MSCQTVTGWIVAAVFTIVWLPLPGLRGQVVAPKIDSRSDQRWAEEIETLIDQHKGEVSVAIENLKTGESFQFQANRPMPTASLIKFPLLAAVYQSIADGDLTLEKMLTLTEEDKVPGSGILRDHFSAGTKISLRDVVGLMMAYSDNTATNLVIDQVGLKTVTDRMEQLGMKHTKLHAKVYRRDTSLFPDRSKDFGLGSTTAEEMIGLLKMLHRGELVDEASSQQMIDVMKTCISRDMIPRLLPGSVVIAHKTGGVSSVRCDAGIVQTKQGALAICVLTRRNEDKSWGDKNAAELMISRISKIAFDHFFAATKPFDAGYGTLREGATGALVEALQRTLNARSGGQNEISVDGDFGPSTRAAVEAFQKSQKIDSAGVVDAATWKALGKLRFDPEPVPDPEVIAAEKLSLSPADASDGPPFVSCKAWAIGDADSGQLIAGKDESVSLPMASTTKIMAAYVVLLMADRNPSVLQETITFSQAADQTRGSTSGVREGESLSVNELLYGLLLPSGNDASVALAEHFGERAAAMMDLKLDDVSPYQQFVQVMNWQADQLGLAATEFQNTHGLTAENHVSSARDLTVLASAAMKLPLFRQIVSTRQRGCTVLGAGGYRRNVLWKNTNRLLAIEGYRGIKTGTTSAAGSCLVSCGDRNGRSLIVVVLGSQSSDARYIDTRNLFRWASNLDVEPRH